jgi:hypothetical protein
MEDILVCRGSGLVEAKLLLITGLGVSSTSPDDAYQFGSSTFNIRKMVLKRTNKQGQTKVYIEVQQQTYLGIKNYDQKIIMFR